MTSPSGPLPDDSVDSAPGALPSDGPAPAPKPSLPILSTISQYGKPLNQLGSLCLWCHASPRLPLNTSQFH
nr:hypothetical protein [Tanacetum cinerariifolium]